MKNTQRLVSYFDKMLEFEQSSSNSIRICMYMYLSNLLLSLNEKLWISEYIQHGSEKKLMDYVVSHANSLHFQCENFTTTEVKLCNSLLLKFIQKAFDEKMSLQLVRILKSIKNRLLLQTEVIVMCGEDISADDKLLIYKKISSIDKVLSSLNIKFCIDPFIIQGFIVIIGIDMYDLSLKL